MKRKIFLVTAALAFLPLVADIASGGDDKRVSVGTFAAEVKSDKMAATKITPALDCWIEEGKNLIFCSTFQMAWNEMCNKYAEGTLEIEKAPDYVEKLNALYRQEPLLTDEAYIAMSGFGKDGIVEKVNKAVREKFKNLNKDELPPEFNYKLGSNEIMTFAYLFRELSFQNVFEKTDPIEMTIDGKIFPASAFGTISRHDKDIEDQYKVLYLNRDQQNQHNSAEVVLRLVTTSPYDDLIISTVPVKKTLKETYENIQRLISPQNAINNHYLDRDHKFDSLSIPKINFNILHEFKDLCGKEIFNKSLKNYNPRNYVGASVLKIAFLLNERGAKIMSYATFFMKGASIEDNTCTIKCPFVIYIKDKSKEAPYFMAYVANEEILVKFNEDDEITTAEIIFAGPNKKRFKRPVKKEDFGKIKNPIIRSVLSGDDSAKTGEIVKGSGAINDTSEDGLTPLLYVLVNRDKVIKALYKNIKKTRRCLDRTAEILEPTHIAYLELVASLISEGSDINARDKDGRSVLMIAEENGMTDFAELLIEKGADINVRDKKGDSALIYSFTNVHPRIIKLLIEKGADVNAKNFNDFDPMLLARLYHYDEIIELINSVRAKSNSK